MYNSKQLDKVNETNAHDIVSDSFSYLFINNSDVTIIESKIEIEFFLENRIESKSIFLAGICNRF